MRIIALNCAKNGKADVVAMRLASNSDVVYVKPYTTKPVPINNEVWDNDDYVHLNDKQLADKMEKEIVAVSCEVGKYKYVYFQNQFSSGFVVLLLDDNCLKIMKEKYGDDLISVRVKSNSEQLSERSGNLRDGFYDIVFDYDYEDIDDLEWRISYDCDKA